jgi:predicted transposase YbfD/YdcC
VTIDAMGCQRKIAQKIIDKGADYILALKGNQGTLRDDVQLLFTEQAVRGFAEVAVKRHKTVEKSHGRLETRIVTATDDIAWLQTRHDWPGLKSIIMVETVREIIGHPEARIERETRFYIASHRTANAVLQGNAIRSHWGIENGLHWVMDMVFRDDECRIRTANAPANFTTIKHIASNLLRRVPGKDSMRVKRRLAAWDEDFIQSIICK